MACKRSSVQVRYPPLSGTKNPSTNAPKGFFIVEQRRAPMSAQFNQKKTDSVNSLVPGLLQTTAKTTV